MQLKTVGESLNALKEIKNIVNNTSLLELKQNVKLAQSLSGYSIEAVKAAIAQSTLNETQIRAILVEKGFKGQLLETTTAELAQTTATNALTASQAGATASTLGLGNAFKGLGASIKAFALSNPVLTAIVAIGVAIWGAVKALDNAADSLEDVESRIQNNKTALSDYTSKIEELTKKLEELNQTDVKYLSDDERKELKTEADYINSQIELYNQLAEAKEKAINDDYIKATMGNNQEIAYKKIWEDFNNSDWDSLRSTLYKSSEFKWYDFLGLGVIPHLLKSIDDGNYIAEADKLLDDYQKLQNKYASLQQTAIDKGNNETLDQNIEETQSQMHQAAAELAEYIEQIQTARDALYNSAYRDDYADVIAQMDEAIANYQSVFTDDVYANKTIGISDLQRDLIGFRDVIQSVSENTGTSTIFEPLIEQINEFISVIELLNTYSFAEILDFDKMLLVDKLSELQERFNHFKAELSDKEFWDKLKTTLSDAVPPEFVENWEKFQNIIKTIHEQFNSLIQDIASKTGLSDILSGLEERLNGIWNVLSDIIDDFGWVFKDAIDAWDNAHNSDYSKRTGSGLESKSDEIKELVDAVNKSLELLGSTSSVGLFTQLTVSQESLDKFQSSVKSAYDAYSTFLSGNYSSSDLLDSIQEISESVSEMGGTINWEFLDSWGDSLNFVGGQKSSLALLGDAIDDVSKKYAESVLSDAGIDVDSKFGQMLANNIIQAQKASMQLDSLNNNIDSLQSAYSNLTDIVETYNETGSVTFDQLQTLLEMEPQYLSCLIDENGQLQLNEQAMVALANQRLNDAEAQAIQQAITELGQLALQDEKQAVQENAEAFTNAVNDLTGYNEELANTIAEATVGAAAIRDLNGAINGAEAQGATDDQINTVLNNLNTKLQLIKSVRDKVVSDGLGSLEKSSAKDTTETFDWIEQAIENVEKEIQKLDDTVNSSYSTFSQKNKALAQEIEKVNEEIGLQQKAYEEYMQKAESVGLSDDYKTLVRDGAINIENISNENLKTAISDYQKWYEKAQSVSDAISDLNEKIKDLHVSGYELKADRLEELLDSESITEKQYLTEMESLYKEYYENQVEYAQKAHEAKLALLEKEKSYLNSVANAASSLLDKEIDKIQDNAKAQESIYQEQIDLLNKKKKPLQDELDALEDKAKEEDLILDLQKKQYELKRAENQRDKFMYKDGQMIYTNDEQNVRSAQKDVDDAQLELQKYEIQKQIDALDEEIDRYNDLIDAVNESADNQVDALEKIKNKWQEVIDQQEYAQNLILLTGEFGDDAITKILTGNDDDLLAQWKNSYISTLADIDMESQGYIGNMTDQIASLYGIDLSPLQNQFSGVKNSVSDMTDALGEAAATIGIGNTANNTSANQDIAENGNPQSSPTENSLKSAIENETATAISSFDQHTDKLNNEVVPAIQSATAEMEIFNETADMDIEKTVTINYVVNGGGGTSHVEGTAKVSGDWSVQSDESKALVGEVGRELIVRNGRFFTVGDNGAEMTDIRKGDIVFNHEQTEELLKNGHISGHGKAYADGTVGGGKFLTPDGKILRPLQPGDKMYDMMQKWNAYMESINYNTDLLATNSMYEHNKQMHETVNQISNANIVNNRNVQPVIKNEIHVVCPGVTIEEVARQLHDALNKAFNGFSNYTNQQSRIR